MAEETCKGCGTIYVDQPQLHAKDCLAELLRLARIEKRGYERLLSSSGEWLHALAGSNDRKAEIRALADQIFSALKCQHDWVDYQCTKCGIGQPLYGR